MVGGDVLLEMRGRNAWSRVWVHRHSTGQEPQPFFNLVPVVSRAGLQTKIWNLCVKVERLAL